MALAFASFEISIQMVGIPIFVGMIASIPHVRAKGDSPVGFRLVVLEDNNTPGSSSTHFPLAKCMLFFQS